MPATAAPSARLGAGLAVTVRDRRDRGAARDRTARAGRGAGRCPGAHARAGAVRRPVLPGLRAARDVASWRCVLGPGAARRVRCGVVDRRRRRPAPSGARPNDEPAPRVRCWPSGAWPRRRSRRVPWLAVACAAAAAVRRSRGGRARAASTRQPLARAPPSRRGRFPLLEWRMIALVERVVRLRPRAPPPRRRVAGLRGRLHARPGAQRQRQEHVAQDSRRVSNVRTRAR